LIEKSEFNKLRAFNLNQSLFYQQFNSVLANQKKTINDSSFQRNDQTLEFNPTNLNIGTKLTNGSDLVYAIYFDS
jgi:hypothetical protein